MPTGDPQWDALRASVIDRFRGVATDVARELGKNVPVASGIGRAAIYATNEKVFAVAESAASRGFCKPCGSRLGIARFSVSFGVSLDMFLDTSSPEWLESAISC